VVPMLYYIVIHGKNGGKLNNFVGIKSDLA
jgi:hypothetical protein